MDNDNRRPDDGPEQEYYRRKELYAERDGRERRPDDGPEQEYYRKKGFYDQVNVGEKIYEGRRLERRPGRTRRRLLMIGIPVLIILLVGALLLQVTKRANTSAIATATTVTPIAPKLTPSGLPTPSPTVLPMPPGGASTEQPGTLLCDGAREGWDGWMAAPEWTDQNGILSSSGTSSASTLLITPCKFNTTHYAIETQIQIAGTTPGSQDLPCFYIGSQGFTYQIDNVPTWAGHEIAINCSGDNTIQLIFADMSAPQNRTVEAQANFNHGFLYHTYRIEVRQQYNFLVFVDGQLLLSYTDDIELAGQIALASYHTQVNVSSFQITAL